MAKRPGAAGLEIGEELNDDTANAVDQKPPDDAGDPRRRRRPTKAEPASNAESDGSGPGLIDTEARTPASAAEPKAESPKAEPDKAPQGDGPDEPAPPKRAVRSRSRKTPAKPDAQIPEDGKPDAGAAADAAAAPTESEAAPKPRSGRSRSDGSGDKPPADKPSSQVTEEKPQQPAAEGEPKQGGDPQQGGDGSGDGPPTRSRRRRRSRRGSGGGSQESKGDKGPSQPKKDNGSDKGKAAASGDPGGDRSSRSSGGKKKRRSSRRPKLQDIAPLGPRKMLITMGPDRCQIAVLEGRELIEHYVAKTEDLSTVGNVYVGRVENVLPGMEAAFLDIGESRNAVLYVGEVSYDEDVDGPAPRIETLLKSGQSVVAQVTKDAMGSKGARLTTEVSLAGRYLVLVPDSDSLGISRRLSDNERRRLRDIASRIRPEGHGMIVRTAANGASEQDLERDMKRLVRIWNETAQKMEGAKPPKLVYAEPPLAIRVIRDLFTGDVEQVIVDDKESYEEVREYLEEVTPELADRVEYYDDKMPLYERFHVMEQVRKAVDRKVWLASGGHIVIDRTEAMTVIDVNTGRFVGRSTLEDTVLHANLEAAEEIAKQLRLRDIGGIIVVDFIDMGYERNRDELVRVFENALLRDKTRTQVYGVSELGLIQMTRKKVSEGLLDAFSKPCDVCAGRGLILTDLD